MGDQVVINIREIIEATVKATEKIFPEIAEQAIKKYASDHPRPSTVTKSQAAAMLNKTVPTLNKILAYEGIELNPTGGLPITAVDYLIASKKEQKWKDIQGNSD